MTPNHSRTWADPKITGSLLAAVVCIAGAASAHGELIAVGHPGFGDSPEGDLLIHGESGTTGTVVSNEGFSDVFWVDSEGATVTVFDEEFMDTNGVVSQKALRVLSDERIGGYFVHRSDIFGINSFDMTLLLDARVLGEDYFVLAWPSSSAESANDVNQMSVTAIADGTDITVIPSTDLLSGQPAGEAFTLSLDQGESVRYAAPNGGDLTGSRITANRRIAVFSGARCGIVPADSGNCSPLFSQLLGRQNLSTRFILPPSPFAGGDGDVVRVLAWSDGTEVFVNGASVASLDAGEFHQIDNAPGLEIETSAPASVAQYLKDDASFSIVPGLDRASTEYTVDTPASPFAINHYLNVAVPTDAIDSVTIGGAAVDESLFSALGATEFSAANIEIDPGELFVVEASAPFVATTSGLALTTGSFHSFVGGDFLPPDDLFSDRFETP